MQSDAESNRILHDEPAEAGGLASLNFRAIDFYVKKYEKSRKHEKFDMSAFVKKTHQMPHACGMVNKLLTNTIFINIEYLCIAIF
jgi:hypothetical protein